MDQEPPINNSYLSLIKYHFKIKDKIMKILRVILTIGTIALNIAGFGQCETENLFLVKHGMTKYEVVSTLLLQENVYDISRHPSFWMHYDYLNGDSVYHSHVSYKIRPNECIKNKNNIITLYFENDKLYQINLTIYFEPDDFEECLNNYNWILKSLKNEFPFYYETILNNAEKEQVGKGYVLYKSKEEMNKKQPEQLTIGFSIQYEVLVNELDGRAYYGSKIEFHKVEIVYSNFKFSVSSK